MINKIRKAIDRTSMIFNETFSLIRGGWGIGYAMSCFIWWISWYARCSKINKMADKKKQLYIDQHINKNYSAIVNKYRSCEESVTECKDFRIWVFWGQGEEKMPTIVKICYRKLKENNDNVQLIDMNNVRQFVQLPSIIYKKLEKGKLLYAHFSDILRNTLLAQYGGLWIDSTVLMPQKMPNIVRECTFFSPHNKRDNTFWCSYAMGSNKIGSVTFSFIRDLLTEVCDKESVWPDYLFQDRVISFARKYIQASKEAIASTPENNTRRFMMHAMMNKPYNEKEYRDLITDNFIFKLSYKANYIMQSQGASTYYGRLMM